MLSTLLLYPDHPFELGTLYGTEFDPEMGCKVRFVIAETKDLPEGFVYAKERRLIDEIKKELSEGRRCQVFAVYTQKHDVNRRLERILTSEESERLSCAPTSIHRNVKPGMRVSSSKASR